MTLEIPPPKVLNNVDYQRLEKLLLRINDILIKSGMEAQMIQSALSRRLYQESYRSFSTHLAESRLFQRFCRIDSFDVIAVPAKSTLQCFAQMYSSEEIQQINTLLLSQAALPEGPLRLSESVDLDTLFMDSTCVKANIHFPVD